MKGEREEQPPSTKPPSSGMHIMEALGGKVPDWMDWHWQTRNLIRNPELVSQLLNLSNEELNEIQEVHNRYPICISPYYLSLINSDDKNDPIKRQSIPVYDELVDPSGIEDPLSEEEDSPIPGLTHRYPDRALLVLTNLCTTYCRFCTRKRLLGKGGRFLALRHFKTAVDYLKEHKEINDIVLSGGDPLTLPNSILKKILSEIAKIDHINIIRIGTRAPVTMPMRLFDDELLGILGSVPKLWINTHFNHPREFTPHSERAIKRIMQLGIPVNNQSVLLKGVNDDLKTIRDLYRALLKNRVRPYYLYHCDPTEGVSHFRTSLNKGLEIIEGLRGHISGLGVPTYVVDAPGGGGKIPIMPNYILSASEDSVILRNYEGVIIKYHPEGKNLIHNELPQNTGISALLEGDTLSIAPESDRLKRREHNWKHQENKDRDFI